MNLAEYYSQYSTAEERIRNAHLVTPQKLNLEEFCSMYSVAEERLKNAHMAHPQLKLNRPHQRDILTEKIKQQMGEIGDIRLIATTLTEDKNFSTPTDIGLYASPRYYPCVWHSHTYLEIIYVASGSCINYLRSGETTLVKGDFFIIPPETSHAVSVFDDESMVINITVRSSTFADTFFSALSEDEVFLDFFKQALYGPPGDLFLLFRTGEDEFLRNKVEEMVAEFVGKNAFLRQMLNSQFLQLAIHIARHHRDSVLLGNSADSSNEAFGLILRYIRIHYRDATIQKLADAFGYSERHISRLIKENTGSTFTALVSAMKLQEATRLLTDEKLTIQRAATQAGYANINVFYRMFHKKYGMTPMNYQKKYMTT